MDAGGGIVVERRATRRYGGAACAEIFVRIRPGHAAQLLDVSSEGALVETSCRLMPGAWIDVRLRAGHATATTRARVLRSAIARLTAERITFLSALHFAAALAWAGELDVSSYAAPAGFPVDTTQGISYPVPGAENDADSQYSS